MELLGFTEENKERLARKEYEENLRTLCLNALDLLDRSDQWESYLELWRQIRENTALTVSYSKQAIDRSELASFIIGETDTSWKVHFLFTTSRRKELIERKLKGRSEVWFGDSFLGKKRIDWKYRRISVGPRQGRRVPSTKVKFQLSLKGGSLRAKFS